MSEPICHAHPEMTPENQSRIQEAAERNLPASRPIQDEELLSTSQQRVRERLICRETGLCLGLNAYAHRVTDAMRVPPGLERRTLINARRLLSSYRVTNREVSLLVGFMMDPERITAFRNTARIMFSTRGELFYYDYVPYQGAMMCFKPTS